MYRIKEVREYRCFTQSYLALCAHVSQPYLSDLEHNRRGAKRETLERIARALNMPVDSLIKEDGESA